MFQKPHIAGYVVNYFALRSVACFMLVILIFFATDAQTKEASSMTVAAERYQKYESIINNKRLGLVVNQTSMVNDQHLVDFLIARKHTVTVIFAPEHGFRGNKGAGEVVANNKDIKTNLPIVSLYGKHKKPSRQHLNGVDLLIFDIQDVGVRYYTYISTMHYVMQACADNNVPLLILDRPNPNGDYIDGPVLDLNYQSFVGMHPIPMVHGLTVAELALMINGEGWLDDGKQCQLEIVKVEDYAHSNKYSLPIQPSPNLPNDQAIRLYPSLGFFEATDVSVGRGTDFPFQVLGYPDSSMGEFEFKARSISGSWSKLNHSGAALFGQRLSTDPNKGLTLSYFLEWKDKFAKQGKPFITRASFLDKLAGQSEFRQQVESNWNEVRIRKSWKADLSEFQKLRSRYLLYPDHPNVLRYSQ